MAEIDIQPMGPADLAAVIALGLSTPEIQDQAERPGFFSLDTLERWIASPCDPLYVARCAGSFAGFIIASFHPLARIGYLYDLAVIDEYRGQGVGKALLEAALKRLQTQQASEIWCLVHQHNPAASRLFQHYGLQRGRRFDLHIWLADAGTNGSRDERFPDPTGIR
ncbi:MAG TPA: GNAT family N-acetyltransferase [Candidatus Obscuribacterales bacterium]